MAFDISERKKLNDSISFLAHHDTLTKLPNRMLLNERMREAIERAKTMDQQVALFVVDLDHFKRINDSLGHWAGDQLLIEVSERLLSAVRKTDTEARVGGDEFIILMPNSGTIDDAYACASRIISKLQPTVTPCCEMRTPRCTRQRAVAAMIFKPSPARCWMQTPTSCSWKQICVMR